MSGPNFAVQMFSVGPERERPGSPTNYIFSRNLIASSMKVRQLLQDTFPEPLDAVRAANSRVVRAIISGYRDLGFQIDEEVEAIIDAQAVQKARQAGLEAVKTHNEELSTPYPPHPREFDDQGYEYTF